MKRSILFIIASVAAVTVFSFTAHSQNKDYASKTDGPLFIINDQVVNLAGDVIIPHLDFRIVDEFEYGFVVEKDRKYALVDTTGTLITQFFSDIRACTDGDSIVDGYFIVHDDNYNHGVISYKTGEFVIPCEYQEISGFGDGLFRVKKDREHGCFIDKTGKVVLSTDDFYNEDINVSLFCEGQSIVIKYEDGGRTRKYGVIDKTGKQIVPFIYEYIEDYSEGLAMVEKDGKKGFIDKSGKLVVPCIFDDAESFSFGLSKVEKNEKWGYIDKTGKVVTGFVYNYTEGTFDSEAGLALVNKDDLFGYINKSGKLVIPCSYEEAFSFSNGLACVYDNESDDYVFIDKNGKVVFSGMYCDTIYPDGFAIVEKDKMYGCIDLKSRTEIVPCEYDKIDYSGPNGTLLVTKEKKTGLVNKSGELILPCLYTDVTDFLEFGEGFLFSVSNYPQYGVVDQEGNVVIPFGDKVIWFCPNALLRLATK